MEKEISEERSEIQEFFEGRSVLVTGASGFLGGVLLEHLLRLCPGIVEIFILLREKKGLTHVERLETTLNKPMFCQIKRDNPEALKKVFALSGDAKDDDLGISFEDLEKLKRNVSVVFHCAASTSYTKDISFMLMNNVVGTYNAISLCKKLPKIAAFVHTSTAYSNCHLEPIKEEVFHIPVPMKMIIEAAKSGNEDFMTALEKDYGVKWWNRYTFSKSIGENVVVEEASNVPSAIIRPSIICSTWKKSSLPGYIEPGTAVADITYGVATGVLQVVLGDTSKKTDWVPANIVANVLIAAAWSIAKKRIDSPLVLNCISSNTVDIKWGYLLDAFLDNPYGNLTPRTIRTPSVILCRSMFTYLLLSFLYHHIPAYFVDLCTLINGGKPRLVKACRMLDKSQLNARPFTLREYTFLSANFDELKKILSKKDHQIFSMDMSGFSVADVLKTADVNKRYQFENDDVQLKFKLVAKAERMRLFTEIYKCFLLFLLVVFLWLIIKLVFHFCSNDSS